jgi:NtrC-family two-component system response regulator AlgB
VRILIVDDEKNTRAVLTTALESFNHEVSSEPSGALALNALRRGTYDALLLDLRLGTENGLDLVDSILRISRRIAIIMITAHASMESAIEALRRGVFDYLPKPCTPDQLREVLARIERVKMLEHRFSEPSAPVDPDAVEFDLMSNSPRMQKVIEVAYRAAESDATMVLLGESGTGKSVLAREIHRRSARAASPFVTVSCPSLSHQLLESELFGHAKGAFTGATTETWGKVAAADGGTLFLDEIGDLPIEIQSRLLRLLQEREYERVGETKSRRANVRVIAATNRNLLDSVAAGKFRQDLYYRLNVISISLPPLRERMNDLESLVNTHLALFAAQAARGRKSFSREALGQMRRYDWPGNLRELRNVVERAVILSSSDEIDLDDLAETIVGRSEIRLGAKISLTKVQDEHIRIVMEASKTLQEAAKVLEIDPTTLYRKRKRNAF